MRLTRSYLEGPLLTAKTLSVDDGMQACKVER